MDGVRDEMGIALEVLVARPKDLFSSVRMNMDAADEADEELRLRYQQC